MHHVDFARRLLRDLDGKIDAEAERLTSGAPQDFPQYRHSVGRRAALIEARRLVTDGLAPDEAGDLASN